VGNCVFDQAAPGARVPRRKKFRQGGLGSRMTAEGRSTEAGKAGSPIIAN
jgi:hypothetical protein